MTSPDKHAPGHPADRADGFERRLRACYREASHQLDPSTAGRLRAARRTALQAAASAPGSIRTRTIQRVLLPAGACAMIVLASLMIWQPSVHRSLSARPTAAAVAPASSDLDSELPPDPDGTDPALYQNLDFYGWLAANDSSKAMH